MTGGSYRPLVSARHRPRAADDSCVRNAFPLPYNNGSFGTFLTQQQDDFRCTFPVDFFHDFSGRDLGDGSVPLLGSVQFDSVGHSGYGDEAKNKTNVLLFIHFTPNAAP